MTFLFSGKVPDWVTHQGLSTQFPQSKYLTGYGISNLRKDGDQTSCRKLSEDGARRSLIERISVNIQSNISSHQKENGGQYMERFSSHIQYSSHLEITGLYTEFYYDKKNKACYALAVTDLAQLADFYS